MTLSTGRGGGHVANPSEATGRMAGEKRRTRSKSVLLGAVAILTCVTIALVVWRISSSRAKRRPFDAVLRNDRSSSLPDRSVESRVEAFCSDCHAMPRADSFPRYAWHDMVRRGYEFYAKSGRNDLDPPSMEQALAYYRSRAPEQLVFPRREDAKTELRARFVVQKLSYAQHADVPPAISHLRWCRLVEGGDHVLLTCDMRRGSVAALDPRRPQGDPEVLARLDNPCRVELCDLDGNGAMDLVVADLGSMPAMDHNRGRVVWLRSTGVAGHYETVVLASGLGRVADVRPVDLNRDGDLDLLVAEFGLRQTGKVFVLRNDAGAGKPPRFVEETLDDRPGAIHVPVLDLNGDGRPDFVALVSQQYEQVDVFINQGNTQFDVHTLWAAPDLTFGSSGIEIVDLDGDGDQDVLYANGDAFDNAFVNPRHGVQWLENRGGLNFAYHRLTDMVGACRASAADIDLDGDLDVIVTAWIPGQVEPANATARPLASLVCLEQKSPGAFARHTLEEDSPFHAALELADFDADGDVDLAVGSHTLSHTRRLPYWLAIWWNQTIRLGE